MGDGKKYEEAVSLLKAPFTVNRELVREMVDAPVPPDAAVVIRQRFSRDTESAKVTADATRALVERMRAGTDWPAFWSSLTPQEVAEALRCAPRVAGAWREIGLTWARPSVPLGAILASVSQSAPRRFYWTTQDASGISPTLDAAKQAADDALRAAGWVLL